MKKVFVLTLFGTPYDWAQEFIDHVQHLEQYGWYWKIFTPNALESKGNVEIIPMTAEQFADLTEKKLGVRPKMFITKLGVPSVHVTDFAIFTGLIFEDYLKDADFWGMTNWDVVYGRLDHFWPDSYLEDCDIFSDDTGVINGVFCLFRNAGSLNRLCLTGNWQDIITQEPCRKCSGEGGIQHDLYGSDEYGMTEEVKINPEIRFKYPQYYPMLSHDRLEQHVPDIKLSLKTDGSLWELFKDTNSPDWIHARPFIGKEIPYFHFIRTKKWPQL